MNLNVHGISQTYLYDISFYHLPIQILMFLFVRIHTHCHIHVTFPFKTFVLTSRLNSCNTVPLESLDSSMRLCYRCFMTLTDLH